jgi:hypothetical protein
MGEGEGGKENGLTVPDFAKKSRFEAGRLNHGPLGYESKSVP